MYSVCWRQKERFFPFEKLFPYQRALLFENIMKHHRRTAWMQQPTCKWIKSSRTLQANRRGRGPCHRLHSCTIPYPLQLRRLSPLARKPVSQIQIKGISLHNTFFVLQHWFHTVWMAFWSYLFNIIVYFYNTLKSHTVFL